MPARPCRVSIRRRERRLATVALVGLAVAGLCAPAAPALAGPAAPRSSGLTKPVTPVSPTPASGTPQLVKRVGVTNQVRQLVECDGTMYAVGIIDTIEQGTTRYPRNNVFSFSATAPFRVTPWKPDVNGEVNTIAFAGGNCSQAYLGGQFTSINGTAVQNIAEVSTSTGAVDTSFDSDANNVVDTIVPSGNHLLTGGYFTAINGSSRAYYASLSPVTGKDDGYITLTISGTYQYPHVHYNTTNIYNQQLSNDGSKLLVEGVFTSVGGQPRQQIFMLDLGTKHATLGAWTSPDFDAWCAPKHPYWIKAAAWSPDDRTIYTATTGEFPDGWNHTYPLTGLCDTVAAFPATAQAVSPEWVNYTGCDSFYSVAADASTVYVGGHERWADNQNGCNHAGPGAIPSPGMGGFTATGGSLLLNSQGTAGLYSRGRGLGADDMLLTSAGLWIADDNFDNISMCGGVEGHAGICFLPYPSS
jgi:hypothetical protein